MNALRAQLICCPVSERYLLRIRSFRWPVFRAVIEIHEKDLDKSLSCKNPLCLGHCACWAIYVGVGFQ